MRTSTNQKWTRGASDAARRIDRIKHLPKRAKGTDPDPTYLKECIQDGYCPWCDTGGFKILSRHTWNAHGISVAELRDIAMMFKHESTCSSEYHAALSNRHKAELASGRVLPSNFHSLKGPHTFSRAGRILQDTVKTQILLANQSSEQRKQAARQGALKTRRPHLCSAGCGTMIPTSSPKTCSPECRRVVRQRTIVKAHNTPLSDATRKKISDAAKARCATGWLMKPRKPHPCPVCGVIIPTAVPRLCGKPECRSVVMKAAADRRREREAQQGVG